MPKPHKAAKPGQPGRKPARDPKAGRPKAAEAVLSPERWKQAQAQWEADDKISASWIADEYGVPLRTVQERIKTGPWTRESRKQMVHVPRPPEPRPPWRPTSFREEFADMLIAYFREPAFEVAEAQVEVAPGRKAWKRKIAAAFEFPTFEQFADTIDVSAKTLWAWAQEKLPDGTLRYPRFSDAYTRAKELQASILVRGGLAGIYNPAVAIFAAKNLLGWKNEVESVEAGGNELYPAQEGLDAAYQRALETRREQDAMVAARKERMGAS